MAFMRKKKKTNPQVGTVVSNEWNQKKRITVIVYNVNFIKILLLILLFNL